jgi:ABC-2 type transport system ATP-binding protein
MSTAFEVKNVYKYFGNIKAVDGISLSSPEGKIFGLLGPNGAGKTTLLKMLATLSEPDRGTVSVMGIDAVKRPADVREIIGLAGQSAAVDELLTGYENLYMVGRLYHLSSKKAKQRAMEVLEEFGLTDAMNRTAKTYSGGMRRRLDLGASLVSRPKILFLDEPTTGLDPRTRLDMWDTIRQLVKNGASILLTTQYLEEADALADHLAVIDHGRVIAQGTPDSLKNQMGGDIIEIAVKTSQQSKATKAIEKIGSRKPTIDETGKIILPVKNGSQKIVDVIETLDKVDVRPLDIALHRPSLDDVFLMLTGKKAEDQVQRKKHARGPMA